MLRTLLVFTCIVASQADTGSCALDGGMAASDLLDAAVYVWASVQRCDFKKGPAQADAIRCSLNVAAAVESVNGMINVIVKAVQRCGPLKDESSMCGIAAGELTKSFAGLAAFSSGVIAKCPNMLNGGKPMTNLVGGASGSLANSGMSPFSTGALAGAAGPLGFSYCLVDMKDAIKATFRAMKDVMAIRPDCADGDQVKCSRGAMKLMSALASIGQYIAGALGRCSRDVNLRVNGQCAEESAALAHHAFNVASAGDDVNMHCKANAARLYELEVQGEGSSTSSNALTFVLGASLPIAAALGFVGGSRLGKGRQSAELGFESELDTLSGL